ncbi:MAG: AmmeMemoRadiSam system protein B, partial [Pseudomonadota bacterium]
MSESVRNPAMAGLFYPSDPAELSRSVDAHLQSARAVSDKQPKAIIAPHAGYMYSGPIAGSAYT